MGTIELDESSPLCCVVAVLSPGGLTWLGRITFGVGDDGGAMEIEPEDREIAEESHEEGSPVIAALGRVALLGLVEIEGRDTGR